MFVKKYYNRAVYYIAPRAGTVAAVFPGICPRGGGKRREFPIA